MEWHGGRKKRIIKSAFTTAHEGTRVRAASSPLGGLLISSGRAIRFCYSLAREPEPLPIGLAPLRGEPGCYMRAFTCVRGSALRPTCNGHPTLGPVRCGIPGDTPWGPAGHLRGPGKEGNFSLKAGTRPGRDTICTSPHCSGCSGKSALHTVLLVRVHICDGCVGKEGCVAKEMQPRRCSRWVW